jgi:hypothetical protein
MINKNLFIKKIFAYILILISFCLIFSVEATAQRFGKNKKQYQIFE